MSELYLVAHKVRGEPAFDVATRVPCPICSGEPENDPDESGGCVECDSTGYWWIVPTSGHRAYPFHAEPLKKDLDRYAEAMPFGLPDHYPTSASPDKPKIDLTALLPKAPPIRRRV